MAQTWVVAKSETDFSKTLQLWWNDGNIRTGKLRRHLCNMSWRENAGQVLIHFWNSAYKKGMINGISNRGVMYLD